jgi:uncharacterized membrane protein
MGDTEKDFPDRDVPFIAWLICIPIGFAIWYVPLYLAETGTFGFITAFTIIAAIIVLLVVICGMSAQSSHKPDTHEKEQTTYTV